MSDEKFASWIILATNDEIEFDELCPTTAAEVVQNLSEDNEKGVDLEHHWKNRINDIVQCIIVPIDS